MRRSLLAASLVLAGSAPGCVIDELTESDVGDERYCEGAERWPNDYADLEDALFEGIEDLRRSGATCGEVRFNPVTALELVPELHCAARLHATDLAAHKTVGPDGSDESTPLSRANLSGSVAHGTGYPCKDLLFYGPSMQEVKLLDGLMLACKSRVLHEKGIRFDERFDFHFYDLDFCRQAEAKGMRMGTWPISVVHESSGNLKSDAWKAGYRKYLDKWPD